jgi:hypothetical protein
MKFILLGFLIVLQNCSNQPSRARFPGPVGRTTDLQRAENTQAVLGGAHEQARIEDTSDQKSIRGIVKLAKGTKVPKKDFVIFISARPLQGGPPLAVLKMKVEKFPFRFSLTEANAMMMGGAQAFEGFVELAVKLDQVEDDGKFDPLTNQEGDLRTSVKTKVGTQNLEVVISSK